MAPTHKPAPASPSGFSRALAIGAIAACGGFGVYGTLYTGTHNGLFDTITRSIGPAAKEPHYPGGPAPYRFTFTGIGVIDRQLATLVAFFTMGIDGAQTWDIIWSNRYLLAQFCAGYSLLVLEGFRTGNRGKLVSWTGTLGVILQNVTYALCVPLYLITHLLSSPVAYPGADGGSSLAVSSADLGLLPFTSIFFFWAPAFLMGLPSPAVLTPKAHYGWDAFWQAFPMWQSIWHWILKQPLRSRATANPVMAHLQGAGRTYCYILFLAVVSHLAILAVALTPATVSPAGWAPVLAQVNLSSALVPYLPWNSPMVDMSSSQPPSPNELAELVRLFLQWDVYSANTAILVWALFLYGAATRKSVVSVLPKAVFWGLLGGPVAVATVLFWERDNLMMDQVLAEKKTA